MHLILFNQVQVNVHVEYFYLSVNGAVLSECMYLIFYLDLKSKFVFTVYLHSEWMFYRDNFLTFQWK